MPAAGAPQRADRSRRRPSFRASFLAAFLLSFATMALWSAATPLFGGPDEPVHVIKAAAVVRGQLLGELVGGPKSPFGRVEVPEYYATTRSIPSCFHGRPSIPASCAAAPFGSATPTYELIYVARYPPLYYAVVGLPSLLGDGRSELYLMRLVSAALSSAFVGLAAAAALAWSRSVVTIGGVIVAATPTALFLGGVVNPTGLEISAAICVWTCGALLAVELRGEPPPGLVPVLALSAATLELVRGLSPFWLGLTAVTLLCVAGRAAIGRMWRSRAVLLAGGIVIAAGALASVWILKEHALDVYTRSAVPSGIPESQILETAFGRDGGFLRQMVGVFGWVDTAAPVFNYDVWYLLVGVLAVLAAVLARLRRVLVLGVLAVAVAVVPVAISASQVHADGFTWSGRDSLPLAVGIPVLAGVLVASRLGSIDTIVPGRLVVPIALLAGCGEVAGFFEALRRDAVGTAGPDFAFLAHSGFDPLLGNAGLLTAAILTAATCTLLVHRVARRGPVLSAPAPEPAA